jgi:L-lactate dehydrogenase complex protein LldF
MRDQASAAKPASPSRIKRKQPRIDFRANVRAVDPSIPAAIHNATAKFLATRESAIESVGVEQWERLRQAGHDVRLHTISYLDHYLSMLEERVTATGGYVHWARDADEACAIVLEIAHKHQVKRAVKVKSMVSEEIQLNGALIQAGIEPLETDLGEFIVQLMGTGPSHVLTPAIHLTKEDIGHLFSQRLGVQPSSSPAELTAAARRVLRNAFLSAELGLSGANFLVAETGTLVLVTNEGNGRMCSTLPPLHVAVVGIEKVVPDMQSVGLLLKLLARSGTGQQLTAYTSFIRGPVTSEHERGPKELHVVLLDNGRSRALQDPIMREALLCIRCGVCLNVCPVYNQVGGYAYGNVYSGPIGSILAPQLLGMRTASDLPFASTLCGACADYCPVKIPIPEILLRLRRRVAEGDAQEGPQLPLGLRLGASMAARTLGSPRLYDAATRVAGAAQLPWRRDGWLARLPSPLSRWTMARPFPAFRPRFQRWWREISQTPAGQRRMKHMRETR